MGNRGDRFEAGPDISFETRGHLRFYVRTPGENDFLLATLDDRMRSRATR